MVLDEILIRTQALSPKSAVIDQVLELLRLRATSGSTENRKLSLKGIHFLVDAAPEKAAVGLRGLAESLLCCAASTSREVCECTQICQSPTSNVP
jgi:hypothetical protein